MHQCLLTTGLLPQTIAPSDWLVVPLTAQAVAAAFSYAQTLRSSATMVRAEVYLADFTSREAIRSLVRERRIRQIAWIETQALPEIEILS
jgi:ATP phosphoribosyltransferase regulatory subunit